MSGLMVALAFVWMGALPQEPAPRVLFDGQGLDGWKATDFRNAGEVAVENGAIVMHIGRAMTGVTSTRGDLPKVDYELTYEARRVEGTDFFAAATFPVGSKFITLVNGGWGGHVTGLSSLNGSDASENETMTSIRYENGRWYRFRVWVTKDRIVAWVDDKPVIDVDYAGVDVRTRLEMRANQPLGFATWESTGEIKSVAVRGLTGEEIASLPKREE